MSIQADHMDYRALLKRANDTLDVMRERLARAERAHREPIAIVGMGLRFPGGAVDGPSFWKLLLDGVDVVTEVPPDRWNTEDFYDPNPDAIGKTYSRWSAFLDDIDRFDANFFGISPREAAGMDPQQRLLLEVTWEALENAGHASQALIGSRTGIFVGMVGSDYAMLPKGDLRVDAYFGTGISRSIAAGRISYALGLRGPSMAIDTACSSSAISTHLACLSLRAGDCSMAVAGGVNLILIPDGSVSASRARMMSFTGRCRAFDASADGYVRAEGCAMLVLKRLSDAVADRDNILGVILGTVSNQDGRSNGITAPNGQAQELLLRDAIVDAGIQPGEVSVIEAHGTGTALGDPIEMRAISAVFGESHSKGAPLIVGSVKTNIGHTEGVAGTAGLIKLLLALEHDTVPPHLHLRDPNPLIPWDSLPVTVPTRPVPWRTDGARRIAGVSSFGFSGTNSHILVAEPPPVEDYRLGHDRPCRLIALSAKTASALDAMVGRYAETLGATPGLRFDDVAFSANTGRTHHPVRLAVLASSTEEAAARLDAVRGGEAPAAVLRSVEGAAPGEVAFLFTGQGSQYVGMGQQLYAGEPVFRAAIDRCDRILRPHLDRPLLSVLYPEPGGRAEAERLINQTAYTQPALFAIEYALYELWRSWGIEPTLVAGHSIGEYVAACVAGVFSLEDGLRLIAARGRLMQALPPGGSMAAVFGDEEAIITAIEPHRDRLSVAAYNGPGSLVLSGEEGALSRVLARLAERNINGKPLTVSHAFHSPLMDPMLDAFAATAADVSFNSPVIGLVSNLTGSLAGDQVASAHYWADHVRAPVRFTDGVKTLHREGCSTFLELGPMPTLLGMAGRTLTPGTFLGFPSLRPGRSDLEQMLETLGSLYVNGIDPDWTGVEGNSGQRRVPLPTYPFERQRYWATFHDRPMAADRTWIHPLLEERIRSPIISGYLFQSRVGVDAPAYLNDHRIYGVPLFPATGFIEMAWAAGREALGAAGALESVRIRDALALPESGVATVQISISDARDGAAEFQVFSVGEGVDSWKTHVSGRIRVAEAAGERRPRMIEEARARCTERLPVDTVYERFLDVGVEYGPAFQCLREVWRRDGEAIARISLERDDSSPDDHHLHPGLLDACLQLLGAAIPGAGDPDDFEDVYVPVEIGSFRLLDPGRTEFWCHVRLEHGEVGGDVLSGDLLLLDEDGSPVAEAHEVQLRRVSRATIEKIRGVGALDRLNEWLYALEWQRSDLAASDPARLAGSWLLLADEGGLAARLAARIREAGGECTLFRADGFDPDETAALVAALESASTSKRPFRGAVHLWGLDAGEEDEADAFLARQKLACGGLLALVQALAAANPAGAGLWLVTRQAYGLPGDTGAVRPVGTSLWGLANAAAVEHAEIACSCIDLGARDTIDPLNAVLDELAGMDPEDRVALRGKDRFAARLIRYAAPRSTSGGGDSDPVELDITEKGILENIVIRPTVRGRPGPGEVEIRVHASGLNFRDVINAFGLYPGNAGPLGSECAGTVVAVGEGVTGLQMGDEVMALAGGTFRSYVIARADNVYPKPAGMTFAEAVSVPITFLTAYYGLNQLAGMKAGDRVLIHAAAGGVGIAAVQLAQRAGAIVFGTAGSPEKHAYLRSIGVEHIMSSRTLDFADEIMRLTDGSGVDIVLNALSDEFIPRSISVLADGGCFLEIGKRGIWTTEQVAEVNATLRYFAYDLSDAMVDDRGWLKTTFDELLPDFDSGTLSPLPLQLFPLDEAADAFRFMAQAKHIGKIVLTREAGVPANEVTIRPDRSYLVTGGLGGLGLAVAHWLVEQGATEIALFGRRPPSDEARIAIDQLETTGARVLVLQGDVGDEADVNRAFAAVRDSMSPLAGVIHAAGLIDDGMLLQQSWSRFETVMRPKVAGSWHLHERTRELALDFFVLFSTGSTLLGSAGQCNYTAANAFLDGLAYHRRALGLPGTSINWGAWSDVGMAATLTERDRKRWRDHGLGMIDPLEGTRILDRIIRENPTQVAVLPMDWSKFLRQGAGDERRPLFSKVGVISETRKAPVAASAPGAFLRQLEAADPAERPELLRLHVQQLVTRVLGLDAATVIRPTQGLSDLGMDSLMAVELSNHLANSFDRTFPATLAFEYPTIPALTELLLASVLESEGREPGETLEDVENVDDAALASAERLEEVARLSEEEAASTLLATLERAGY